MAMRDPRRPWLWPRHTTGRKVTGAGVGREARRAGGGRGGVGVCARAVFVNARVQFGSKKLLCVDGGAASLDDPPGPALCDLKARMSVEPTPTEGEARRPPALRRHERKSTRARNGKRQFYVQSNFRTFTCTGSPDVHSAGTMRRTAGHSLRGCAVYLLGDDARVAHARNAWCCLARVPPSSELAANRR